MPATPLRHLLRPLPLLALLMISATGHADTVVVMARNAAVSQLSHEELTQIYLSRYRRLPDGTPAIPLDLPDEHPIKADFYQRLVNKSLNEIGAYWSRLIFSGRTQPPRQAQSTRAIAQIIDTQKGAIAYLDRSQVNQHMQIVFEFPR